MITDAAASCWPTATMPRCWRSTFLTAFDNDERKGNECNDGNDASALIGRILIAAMFVYAGYGKIGGFDGTVGYIGSVGLPARRSCWRRRPSWSRLVGGAMLLSAGRRAGRRFALAGFTVVASVLFHNFWAMPAAQPDAAADVPEEHGDDRRPADDGWRSVPAGWSVDRR